MAIAKKNPIGLLDQDSSDYTLEASSTRYRLNLRLGSASEDGGNIGYLENIKGNTQIPFSLPSGNNLCIGNYVYEKNHCIYFFVYNSLNFDTIYEFNFLTGTVTKVLQNLTDTLGVDVLNFSPDSRINHINLLDGDEIIETGNIDFSLSTGINLAGTTAELISTGVSITDPDNAGGLITVNTPLTIDRNIVKVTTDKSQASTITVNGQVYTNVDAFAGVLEVFFIVDGVDDILVEVLSGATPPIQQSTGIWAFLNTHEASTFIDFAVNSVAMPTISPDDFPLTNTQNGSVNTPTGINVFPSTINTFTAFSTPSIGGFVDLQINVDPVVSFPISSNGVTSMSVLVTPTDNVTVELRNTPAQPALGTWTFSNTSATNSLISCTVNGNTMPAIAPNNFPLSTTQSGNVTAPSGITIFPDIQNTIVINSTAAIAGFIDISKNAGPIASYAVNLSGTTNIQYLISRI